jgi:hypothetical protein
LQKWLQPKNSPEDYKAKHMVAAVVFARGLPMVKHLHDQNLALIGNNEV